jgi:hypothetical protein
LLNVAIIAGEQEVNVRVQFLLVELNWQAEVTALPPNLLDQFTLGVHRTSGHDHAAQVEWLKQLGRDHDFILFVAHWQLGKYQPLLG